MPITIRRASASDVPAMHSLQMRAFEEEGRRCGTRDIPPLQEQPAAIAEHVRSQIALVATEGGAVVGCVRGIRDGAVCTIRALVVEPSLHGRGVGSALVRALEAASAGLERIDLTTNTLMEGNVPFYERHGYRVCERTEPIPGIVLAHLTKALVRDIGAVAPGTTEGVPPCPGAQGEP